MPIGYIIDVMKEAALAGYDAIQRTRTSVSWERKEDKELVTNSDIESEKAIIDVLRRYFPESSVLSEEAGYKPGKDNLTWILDPIDGTHNFIHNIPFYAIPIGLYKDETPYAGLIFLPEFNQVYHAVKGGGAYMNGEPIRVSKTEKLRDSMIAYDNQFHRHPQMLDNLQVIQESCLTLRIFGSAAVDICNVAKGSIEARVFHRTKSVDFAAGGIMVEEAGGKISDFNGKDVTLETEDVLVSNGRIHEELLSKLQKDARYD